MKTLPRHSRSSRITISAAAAGALAVALAGPAQALNVLTCHAWPTQTCHYALTRDGVAAQRFTLHNGEGRTLQGAEPGQRYMMSINFDPPAAEAACSRSPHPEAKRSSWCLVGVLTASVHP